MGVLLTPIVVKKTIALGDVRDRVIAALERAFGPQRLF